MRLAGFTGDARLYRVSEPVEFCDGQKTEFVVVSATYAMFSGPETYVFPANADGDVLDWGELDGSRKGDASHDDVLRDAGYVTLSA